MSWRLRWGRRTPNLERQRLRGEQLLPYAGAANLDEAKAVLENLGAPAEKRRLAARAIGLLGVTSLSGEQEWQRVLSACDPRDDSPLSRACDRARSDLQRRGRAEYVDWSRSKARQAMIDRGYARVEDALRCLRDHREPVSERAECASILGGFRYAPAVGALIDALAEGDLKLSWACSSALFGIESRRGARKLGRIALHGPTAHAKEAAIYTIWMLHETRAEDTLIRLSRALDHEEEHTRSMATEVLGNTIYRLRTQRAVAERLFDPSVDVRYSALCALGGLYPSLPEFVKTALRAKLNDPDRVDEHRVIAEYAAELLGRASS